MAKSPPKTNAMRILDRMKIPYVIHSYESDGQLDGVHVAEKAGLELSLVYKTLVTRGKTGEHYVFVIPVARELDLKAAAASVGEKNVEMIHVREINQITGYIRGGCSPVGMKKQFRTVIDSSAAQLERIYVSAGKIGVQMELLPDDLKRASGADYREITM